MAIGKSTNRGRLSKTLFRGIRVYSISWWSARAVTITEWQGRVSAVRLVSDGDVEAGTLGILITVSSAVRVRELERD